MVVTYFMRLDLTLLTFGDGSSALALSQLSAKKEIALLRSLKSSTSSLPFPLSRSTDFMRHGLAFPVHQTKGLHLLLSTLLLFLVYPDPVSVALVEKEVLQILHNDSYNESKSAARY